MEILKRTWAEIDLDAVASNLENYKSRLPAGVGLMCVVKAACYGHSDLAVCPMLQELGVKWYAVSNAEEALRLREIGINGDILILGSTPPEAAAALAEHDIIQAVTDEAHAIALDEALAGRKLRCHAAIDTGMTRIGFRGTPEETAERLKRISGLENIKLEGIFTHYAVADSTEASDRDYTAEQTRRFFAVRDAAEAAGITLEQCHCLNSAGGLCSPDPRSTLARLGIVLYGLYPDRALPLPFEPEPVMTLRSTISMIKRIEAGESVSYGRTFTADRPMTVATVTCGYADGYPRALSNKGYVLLHGQRAPIIGRVCMDQFMIDISGITGVVPFETVTLMGTDGSERLTADDLAALTGTIGYEIVCGITSRVPRVAYRGGERIGVFRV